MNANQFALPDCWSQDWPAWLSSAHREQNIDVYGDVYGPTVSLYSLAVEEALNGAGVLMAHEALVASHLQRGALVAPFNIKVELQRFLSIRLARIALGLFTSPVAFLSSGMAAVGYWMSHGTKDLFPINNGGEIIALYCFIFLFMATRGSGTRTLPKCEFARLVTNRC